jgi:hypothetical protein
MGQLIYGAITSLDGFIEDKEGKFDWAEPDEEVHSFVNDIERDAGTYLWCGLSPLPSEAVSGAPSSHSERRG